MGPPSDSPSASDRVSASPSLGAAPIVLAGPRDGTQIEDEREIDLGAGVFTPRRFGLLLALVLFGFAPKVWLGIETFFFRDYGVLAYPFMRYARESFWRGELPLWNPLSNCGAPFLAQWGTMTLYPLSLFYLVFPLPWSLNVFCLGHLWLAGFGVYTLARRWTSSPLAAAFAGITFVLSGATISCLLWPNYCVALAWMPWVILTVERACSEGGREIARAALVSSMQMLSGAPELVLMTWGIVAAVVLSRPGRSAREWSRELTRVGAVIVLTGGLCAAQLLPFFELLAQSQRSHAFVASKWPMPSWGLANLLIASYHCIPSIWGPLVQAGQNFFSSYYLGVTPLVLGLAAIWDVRRTRVSLLLTLVVVSLFLAMGDSNWLYREFKQWIPGFGLVRYPVKFVLLAAFVIPLLAAWTLSHWQRSARRPVAVLILGLSAGLGLVFLALSAKYHPFIDPRWSPDDQKLARAIEWGLVSRHALGHGLFLVAALAALLVGFKTTGWKRRLAELGLILSVAMDLATQGPTQNPTIPTAILSSSLYPAESPIQLPAMGTGRVLIPPGAERRLLRGGATNAVDDMLGKRLALWSNLNLLENAPKVNGSSTLQMREERQVEDLIANNATNAVGAGLINFLGVTLVSRPDNPTDWIRNPEACPMVTGGQAPLWVSDDEALTGVAGDSFDSRRTVFLPREAQAQSRVTEGSDLKIVRQEFFASRVQIDFEAADTAFIVIAQSYHPRWRARVDGQDRPVWRANHAFQAVEVPPGRHTLTLAYRDDRFMAGAAFSGFSLLICGGWLSRRPKTVG